MAGTLSGGEQQMLVIGRALISRPSVWVLDEPFLGLVVDGHGAHGRTIADRVMTLHEGRLSPADDGRLLRSCPTGVPGWTHSRRATRFGAMARKEDFLGHLAKVPLFSMCGKGELRQVARRSTKVTLDEGKVFVEEGTTGREFFVILEGRAEVTRESKPVAELGPGDFVGELSLLDPGPRDATVTALTPVTVMVLTPLEFEAVLKDAPGMTRKLLAGMAYRLRDLDTSRS